MLPSYDKNLLLIFATRIWLEDQDLWNTAYGMIQNKDIILERIQSNPYLPSEN